MKISRIPKRTILLCSVCAYILSLFLPAFLQGRYDPEFGGTVLAFGWLGILEIGSSWDWLAWWANPTYFFAIIAFMIANLSSTAKKIHIAPLILTGITLLLGFISFHAKTWPRDEGPGSNAPITALGIGFYVWMLSFLILLVGCLIPFASASNPSLPPDENTPISLPK